MAIKVTRPLKKRLINGKRYQLEESHERKGLAVEAAKGYRQRGRKARVIKRRTVGGRILYSVYVCWA